MSAHFPMRQVAGAVASLVVAVLMLALAAANAPPGAAQEVQLAPVDVEGEIVAVAPPLLHIRTATGQPLVASLDPVRRDGMARYENIPEPNLEITGEETVRFLKVGMYVRFEGVVGAGRNVQGEIDEITVFTPTRNAAFGVLADENEEVGDKGVGGEEDAAEAGAGEGAGGAPGAGPSLVAGQLFSLRGETLAIAVPGGRVRGNLAKNAVVKLAVSDPAFARPGDKVHLEGLAVQPPNVFATNVKVTRLSPAKAAASRFARGEARANRARNALSPPADRRPGGRDPFALGDPRDQAKPGDEQVKGGAGKPAKGKPAETADAGGASRPARGRLLKIN
jgi:hypothetical protein